jgi:hypothetical protein
MIGVMLGMYNGCAVVIQTAMSDCSVLRAETC